MLRLRQPADASQHILRGTRIDRSIVARDVLNRRVEPTRLFRVPRAKQFLHKIMVKNYWYTSATLIRIPRTRGLKPHAAKVHQHHNIVAHSVLNNDAHVTQTAALVVGNNNVALCLFARILQAVDSFVWVLRSCGTGFGLAKLCCNFSVSSPQALFFWHVSSITKKHILHADNNFSIFIFKFVISNTRMHSSEELGAYWQIPIDGDSRGESLPALSVQCQGNFCGDVPSTSSSRLP
jgi:hypothetical protein